MIAIFSTSSYEWLVTILATNKNSLQKTLVMVHADQPNSFVPKFAQVW
jgi:hypothetical protein